MSESLKPITANSRDGGEVYRLLAMVHAMAGRLANSPSKEFQLASTNSNPAYGPITTVWTNGIVNVEARTWRDQAPAYHEYAIRPAQQDKRGAGDE